VAFAKTAIPPARSSALVEPVNSEQPITPVRFIACYLPALILVGAWEFQAPRPRDPFTLGLKLFVLLPLVTGVAIAILHTLLWEMPRRILAGTIPKEERSKGIAWAASGLAGVAGGVAVQLFFHIVAPKEAHTEGLKLAFVGAGSLIQGLGILVFGSSEVGVYCAILSMLVGFPVYIAYFA
jgi:hypothetical protein